MQLANLLGPSLFARALQLILTTRQRAVFIRVYLETTVSVTPLAVCSTLADIAALSAEINVELNYSKCALWPSLQPRVSGIFPSLRWLLRQEGLRLVSISFEQAQYVQKELDTLVHTQATLSGELLTLTSRDPHESVKLLRFCVGPA